MKTLATIERDMTEGAVVESGQRREHAVNDWAQWHGLCDTFLPRRAGRLDTTKVMCFDIIARDYSLSQVALVACKRCRQTLLNILRQKSKELAVVKAFAAASKSTKAASWKP